jgi:MHS family alpha-ketoglutarate permease-like MFS transporter
MVDEAGVQIEAAKPRSDLSRLKAIVGGSAGNLVEWYDWFAYASFALYFAPVFFPEGDRTAQLMQSAAVFAVGFVARPFGAWMMGLYADRAGRRAALALSVGLMCLGSLGIALTPGYDTIGAAAPVLLVIIRIVQGLSLGGEYGASATYLSEMSTKDRRGLWSSVLFVTLIAGQLIALSLLILLQNVMTPADLEAWGWRIPFVVGALLAVVVFWIRMGLDESRSFINARDSGAERASTMMLLRHHPKETAVIFGLTAGGSLAFYAYTTYMQKFLVNTSGFSKNEATGIMAGALFLYMCAQPVFGWLSDKVGRRSTLIWAFGGAMLASFPVMSAIAGTDSIPVAFGLIVLLLLILSGYTSVSAVVKAELFPAHIRALGVALPYAASNAIFGGAAEYVALRFKASGLETGFYVYVSVICAVALVIALRLRETKTHSLILED